MIDEASIQEQIDRLPVKIGNFVRRFAQIEESITIQYTTNGFYFDNNRLNTAEIFENDVLYSETGNNLKEIVDEILIKIEVDRRLERIDKSADPFLYIHKDLIDQGITTISIIKPTGTVFMLAPCGSRPFSWSQHFFIVQTDDYLLAFGRKGNSYYLIRNDSHVTLPIPQKAIIATEITLVFVWSVDEIGISGYIGSEERKGTKPKWEARYKDWKHTSPTVPSNSLYSWARRQLLISSKNYLRPGQVLNVITEAFHAFNEELSRSCDLGAFWDEQRNGKKITRTIPKREPVITRHIESRIREITIQKNIDITREIEIGNSKLDLLFSAPLENGKIAKVCVEVKMAHASDLVHGLSIQLPEYMRRIGTDYGIYCVLYFGKDYQHQVRPFSKLMYDPDFDSKIEFYQNSLEALLSISISNLPYTNMVAIIIDVSQKPSASKM